MWCSCGAGGMAGVGKMARSPNPLTGLDLVDLVCNKDPSPLDSRGSESSEMSSRPSLRVRVRVPAAVLE